MKYDNKFLITDIYDMIADYGVLPMSQKADVSHATLYNWTKGKTHRKPKRDVFERVLKVLELKLEDVKY